MADFVVEKFSIDEYLRFMELKSSPMHGVVGRRVHSFDVPRDDNIREMSVADHLFDYQDFITRLAISRERFAVFADVGLGKTAIFLEWCRHISKRIYPKKTIIITQLHLINQTIEEQLKFYHWSNITNINSVFGGDIDRFCAHPNNAIEGMPVGIVNADKFRTPVNLLGQVGAVILDESSCLKNETGKIRTNIINACKGIPYKLACTATPAPNDRQEYANHALFLDYIDNFKQFFTKYFYNTGSGNDFELKPHAMRPFYEFLATWSIFLKHPKVYGFNDNLSDLKPAEIIWDRIGLTEMQKTEMIKQSGGQLNLFGFSIGGIKNRSKASQISKGFVYS